MRNANSRFATLPRANIQRSKFKRGSDLKTAFNSGKLVPIFCEKEVLPGDTHSLKTTISVRMSTPIHPVMDDAYLDTYFSQFLIDSYGMILKPFSVIIMVIIGLLLRQIFKNLI